MGIALAFAAAGAGAVLGLVASPDPDRQQRLDQLSAVAAAAVEGASRAEARANEAHALAKATRASLVEAQARLAALGQSGAAQEAEDVRAAEALGISTAISRASTSLWGGDKLRVMAAIVREARRNGLDPLLVAAVIQVESHFDPFAVSSVGACGLMQLMPPTAQALMPDRSLRAPHLFNPVLNVELGTAYLSQLMGRFDGDLRRALIAYNAGPTAARSLTRNSAASKRLGVYPKAVLAAYRQLLTAEAPPALASLR